LRIKVTQRLSKKSFFKFINNPKWRSLLDHIDVHIIPVLNPDGYEYTWTRDS